MIVVKLPQDRQYVPMALAPRIYVALYDTGQQGRYHWALTINEGPIEREGALPFVAQIRNDAPPGETLPPENPLEWRLDHGWREPWATDRMVGCVYIGEADANIPDLCEEINNYTAVPRHGTPGKQY